MTLRYDPSQQRDKPLNDLSYKSMKKRTVNCPSYIDIERDLRTSIRKHILKIKYVKISLALSWS